MCPTNAPGQSNLVCLVSLGRDSACGVGQGNPLVRGTLTIPNRVKLVLEESQPWKLEAGGQNTAP